MKVTDQALENLASELSAYLATQPLPSPPVQTSTNSAQNLKEWLENKSAYNELDLTYPGIGGVADYVASYGDYPEHQRAVVLGMILAAATDIRSTIGWACADQLCRALSAGFDAKINSLDFLMDRDLLYFGSLLDIWDRAHLVTDVEPCDGQFPCLVIRDELESRGWTDVKWVGESDID